jgi:uncharacterized protein (TIGR00730 family)
MQRICVFAGSNPGNNPEYTRLSRSLGQALTEHHFDLVYGGSRLGLMAEVANQVLSNGGHAIGVIPTGLFTGEIVHTGLSELIEVQDMHERKSTMNRLSDGFIALPGGLGTFEELFEVLSWAQLGIHNKPVGVLNVDGYYTPLLRLIDHAVEAGFVQAVHKELLIDAADAMTLLDKMKTYQTPSMTKKWTQL